MKKFTAILLLAAVFFSCKKEDPPLFTIPINNLTLTLTPALNPNETHFFTVQDVPTNALAVFAGKGVDTASIRNIRPYAARLYVVFGESELDFLEGREVEVRICQKGMTADDYCGMEVFYHNNVPFDVGYELDLFGSNVDDVRQLILQQNLDVRIIFRRFNFPPPTTFDIRLDMEFGVW